MQFVDTAVKHTRVTVLMPVYNGEKHLREAIDSVLNQTYKNFELMLINDGSTDSSLTIMQSYNDPRIRIINNESNLRLIDTLNKGLDLIQTEYVVRFDCDDICLPERLEKQVKFMDSHPEVGASGSYFVMMRSEKEELVDLPVSRMDVKAFLLFNSPIAHPAAIIRKSVLDKNNIRYTKAKLHAEDYQLWRDISKVADLANIPEVLIKYRVHENQISSVSTTTADKTATLDQIRSEILTEQGIVFTMEELAIHHLLANGEKPSGTGQLHEIEKWLLKLAGNNWPDKEFAVSLNKIMMERWLRACINVFGASSGVRYFLGSNFRKRIKLSFRQKRELVRQFYLSYKRLRNR